MLSPEQGLRAVQNLVLTRVPYIDTVKVYVSRRIDDVEYLHLIDHSGQAIRMGALPYKRQWPNSVWLHQPKPESLKYLQEGFDAHIVTRVDIALDLVTASKSDAARVMEYVANRFVMQHRGKDPVRRYRGTVYFTRASAPNNVAIYCDKPSKIDGRPCCHIEWRICSAHAVAAAGMHSISAISSLDHHRFWVDRLVMKDYPTSEGLGRLGKKYVGQPKRRKQWKKAYGPRISSDWFVRIGSTLLRRMATHQDMMVQQMIDAHGPSLKDYLPTLPTTWMLPPAQTCEQTEA